PCQAPMAPGRGFVVGAEAGELQDSALSGRTKPVGRTSINVPSSASRGQASTQLSMLFHVPKHRDARCQNASYVLASGRRRVPLTQMDILRPFRCAQLTCVGDALMLGEMRLARKGQAQSFHLGIAGPAGQRLVAA